MPRFTCPQPLTLRCGAVLPEVEVAYHTWGELSPSQDNAILICHTMTQDARAGGDDPPGWWHRAVGPGRAFDTSRYFVVCSNVLGGCGGTTGPGSLNPATGRPYGLSFPVVSVADMVALQRQLQEHLGLKRWHAIAGGCLGGFQALTWASQYPEASDRIVALGSGPRTSAYSLAFFEVLRQAIYADPGWNEGDYTRPPGRGIALSAMLGTLFWMTPAAMEERFGRTPLPVGADLARGFSREPAYSVEGFLHQIAAGSTARAFDPNALLYLTRASSDFDLGDLDQAFAQARSRFLLISYASDLRYPPEHTREVEQALHRRGCQVTHQVVTSRFGHGAFLLDPDSFAPAVQAFLADQPAGSAGPRSYW